MSVGTLVFQLPFRACAWIKYLADKKGLTARQWVAEAVLRHLADTPGVDLSRSPDTTHKGGSDAKG